MDRFQVIEVPDDPTVEALCSTTMAFLLPNGQRAMASTLWAVGQQGMPRQRPQTGSSATGSGSASSGFAPPPPPTTMLRPRRRREMDERHSASERQEGMPPGSAAVETLPAPLLPFAQDAIARHGWAIEARINA